MRIFFALLLMAAAGSATPQAQKADPSAERPASPVVAPAPRLNLKLDNPAQYTRETPREGSAGDSLPSLGANARPIPTTPTPTTSQPPFPKDTQQGGR